MDALDEPHDGQAPVNTVKPEAEFRFALRPFEPGDLPFIGESWRRSYSDSNWARCPGGKGEYIATQRAFIEQALSTSQVVVAYPEAPEERREQILGWCCYRRGPMVMPCPGDVIHYVFVKPYYRRLGVARLMLDAILDGYATRKVFTSCGWRRPHGRGAGIDGLMAKAKARGITVEYNPALIFGGKA